MTEILLDHFHPPLKGLRHWEAFHSGWANTLATELNLDVFFDALARCMGVAVQA